MKSLSQIPFPWLESIYFTTLRLYYRCRANVTQDGFCGHNIRGAIGHRLKSYMNCHLDQDMDCRTCEPLLQNNCLYARLFEHGGNRVKPFVLRLDPAFHSVRTVRRKGDILGLDLILIGNAVSLTDYLVDALRQNPLRIGKNAHLLDLVSEGHVQYDKSIIPFEPGQQMPLTGLDKTAGKLPSVSQLQQLLEFTCHTPTEITNSHKRFIHDPNTLTFKILMLRMRERTRFLATRYCGWSENPDDIDQEKKNRETIDMALNIELLDHRARWIAVADPGKPTRKRGGLVGSFRFEGQFENFTGLLDAAACLGLGKGCTSGLGQVSFDIIVKSIGNP